MAFFPINKNSTFGRPFVRTSELAAQLVDLVDAHVARMSEMSDANFASEYGPDPGLSRSAALTTLQAVQARLNDPSIANLINRIG